MRIRILEIELHVRMCLACRKRAGTSARPTPPASESVVENWYNSKERAKGLSDAEKRVAAVALVLLVGAFVFIKLTAKQAAGAQKLHARCAPCTCVMANTCQ